MIRHSIFYCPTETPRRLLATALKEKSGRELQTKRRLYDAIECAAADDITVVGPAIGVPASALIVEWILKHHSAGARVVLIGTCGCFPSALNGVRPGDIVFPEDAFCSDLQRQLEERCAKLIEPLQAAAYRTAVLTALHPAGSEAGAGLNGAVEMELAPLASAARSGKFELGAAFVVSDIVGGERAFNSEAVRSSLKTLCEAAALTICGGMG